MHIQTHVMSGWLAGNCFTLTPRERFLCMVAAAIPDLDGLGWILGEKYFHDYHHVVGHNLLFALLTAAVLTIFSTHRLKAFVLYMALFHLHLLLDLFGSGELWTIMYGWPFSRRELASDYAWSLYSWQNLLAGGAALLLTLWIACRCRRTPLEYLMPSLDRQLVNLLLRVRTRKQINPESSR